MEKSCIWNFEPIERVLPKSWEEFCKMFPIKKNECYINNISNMYLYSTECKREYVKDANVLPNEATAEAFLALNKLIQLRNCYNGDWVPDWDNDKPKYIIEFMGNEEVIGQTYYIYPTSPLCFKTEELRDLFLKNFRSLIEKLKPLYNIK